MATDINFATDATAAKELGFGCTFQKSWTYVQWEKNFIRDNEPSIEFLELYALCMGIFTWQKSLSNKRILIFCDNEAVVHMVNNTASSCPYCMNLIRSLTLKCLNINTRVFVRHLAGVDNILLDRLSKLRLEEFRRLTEGQGYESQPSIPSAELWPLTAYWKQHCQPLKSLKMSKKS